MSLYNTEGREQQLEMVTPKLTYAEPTRLQECARRVRKAGAKVDSSRGIHVHVDASNHNRQSLKNLIGILYAKEAILFKELQVSESRAERWCKKVREPMPRQARTLSSEETTDLTQLEQVWYEGNVNHTEHYNWTRYYNLNLYSVFYHGTVTWRCFNSTPHAGKVAAYVNLYLAISAQVIAQRSTVMRKTHRARTGGSPSRSGWCGWAPWRRALSIDEQRRAILRDPSRDELAPKTPLAGERKTKRREAER